MPSPSVSGLQGSRPSAFSERSERRSLSSSVSYLFLVPSESQSPCSSATIGFGGRGPEITGESERLVNRLPNRFASTRSRNRVGTGLPARIVKNFCTVSGTVTRSIFLVPNAALTNTARAPSRLNTTVFLLRPRLKLRPRIVSASPTATSLGATPVITGVFFFAACADGATAPAAAETMRATEAARKAARRDKGRVRDRSSIALVIGGGAR